MSEEQEVSDPVVATAARLRLAVTRIHRRLRQHSSGDLTLTQGSILATVGICGPITLGELASIEQVAPPTITKVVVKLEQHGFVQRQVDPKDRRVNRVSVTELGVERLDQVRTARTAWLSTRLAAMAPDELGRISQALELLEALGAEPIIEPERQP